MWQKARYKHSCKDSVYFWPDGTEMYVKASSPETRTVTDPSGKVAIVKTYITNVLVEQDDERYPRSRGLQFVLLPTDVELLPEFVEEAPLIPEKEFLANAAIQRTT